MANVGLCAVWLLTLFPFHYLLLSNEGCVSCLSLSYLMFSGDIAQGNDSQWLAYLANSMIVVPGPSSLDACHLSDPGVLT